MQLFCQEMAEAINEGKALREQDGVVESEEKEISEEEKQEVLEEAMSEEDFEEEQE